MADRAYELTWEALDHMEAQGLEITETLVEYMRAVARSAATVLDAIGGYTSECGHVQDGPTGEEVDRAEFVIARTCDTCEAPLWWNAGRWRRL